MTDYSRLRTPVEPAIVTRFLDDNRSKFKDTYEEIRLRVERAVRSTNVHKIYGRAEKQFGEILKDSRKVLYKFNSYHDGEFGSLWDMPDIVGFTIVVPYPSDISPVCAAIDQLIDKKDISNVTYDDDPQVAKPEDHQITSKHGRVLDQRGYFACHYNLRTRSIKTDTMPICEIQIKTVLHDGWGAKTHDLTYKNNTEIDPILTKSFELLGDALAKLDQQSDLVRESLEKRSKVRHAKQQKINDDIATAMLSAAFEDIKELEPLQNEFWAASPTSDTNKIDDIDKILVETSLETKVALADATEKLTDTSTSAEALVEIHKNIKKLAQKRRSLLVIHHFLAERTKDRIMRSRVEDGLAVWESTIEHDFEKVKKIAFVALLNFYSGNRMIAIEETQRAVRLFDKLDPPNDPKRVEAFWRRGNSCSISLAYYYAERIRTHEGNQAKAEENARTFLKKSLGYRSHLASCPASIDEDDELLLESLHDPDWGESNFDCLDCEAFVRIQTSGDIVEVTRLRDKLLLIHGKNGTPKQKPLPEFVQEAASLYEFHEYCIRQRLLELE